MRRVGLRFAAVAVGMAMALTFGAGQRAWAEPPFQVDSDGITAAVGGVSMAALGLPGIISAGGVGSSGVRSRAWRVAGGVLGALNLVAGMIGIGLSASNDSALGAAISGGHLLIGAVNVGLSIRASLNARSGIDKISLVPVTGVGAKRQPFAGVAVRLASF